MLNLIMAAVAITVYSLPLGILLALGRRSEFPVISRFCVLFIEFWRGVPLITVLVMASFMLPFFMPDGFNFNELLRALVGLTLFSSAYMAEVVRGGLQALPKGQTEAARAMGLTYWQSIRLIIMPQALKLVIPGNREYLYRALQGYGAGASLSVCSTFSRSRSRRSPIPIGSALSTRRIFSWRWCSLSLASRCLATAFT